MRKNCHVLFEWPLMGMCNCQFLSVFVSFVSCCQFFVSFCQFFCQLLLELVNGITENIINQEEQYLSRETSPKLLSRTYCTLRLGNSLIIIGQLLE